MEHINLKEKELTKMKTDIFDNARQDVKNDFCNVTVDGELYLKETEIYDYINLMTTIDMLETFAPVMQPKYLENLNRWGVVDITFHISDDYRLLEDFRHMPNIPADMTIKNRPAIVGLIEKYIPYHN